MPPVPRRVLSYLNHAKKNGPDCVLETAEEDEDLTDEEWELLWQRMTAWDVKYRWDQKTRKWIEKLAPKPILCEGCGLEIPPEQMGDGGRPRKFHDNNGRCKQLAYRKRRQRVRESNGSK